MYRDSFPDRQNSKNKHVIFENISKDAAFRKPALTTQSNLNQTWRNFIDFQLFILAPRSEIRDFPTAAGKFNDRVFVSKQEDGRDGEEVDLEGGVRIKGRCCPATGYTDSRPGSGG